MSLTKAARYGLYAVVLMARSADGRITAGDVAAELGISEHHVSKVLQQLARAGLIAGARGAGGGYELARSPAELTMLEIVETLQGAQLVSKCASCELVGTDACRERSIACSVHGVLHELSSQAYYTLKSVTIATLARDTGGLRVAALRH